MTLSGASGQRPSGRIAACEYWCVGSGSSLAIAGALVRQYSQVQNTVSSMQWSVLGASHATPCPVMHAEDWGAQLVLLYVTATLRLLSLMCSENGPWQGLPNFKALVRQVEATIWPCGT